MLNAIKPVVQSQLGDVSGVTNAGGVAQMSSTVEGLLGRYTNYLTIPTRVFNVAKHIANVAQHKAQIDGRNYASIASGVLWVTCILMDYPLKTKELSQMATITDSTIKL